MSTRGMPEDAGLVYRRYVGAVVLHSLASAAALGLGATDLYALNALELGEAMTSGELAAATGLTTGATTRLIDRLERAGHVRRVADPADRRKVVIEPVAQPSDRTDEIFDPVRRRVGEVLAGYSQAELRVLFDYFARAARAYEESTAELRPPRPDAS